MFNEPDKTIEVSIRMLDGATVRGTLSRGNNNSTLEGILSRESPFLEFVSKQGQRKFVSKHQVAYVEPVEPLRKPVLVSPADSRYADAFSILGLRRGCSFDQAKAAFHAKAKLYHPDSHSGSNLPPEVARYLAEMFKQINTAFTEVRSEFQSAAA